MDTILFRLIRKRQKDGGLKDIKDIKMDSKHQENYLNKYDEKSLEKLQSKLVFTDSSYLFVFKKTEKIVAALYLVTNLVPDIEPIKWQLRKTAAGLITDILALKRSSSLQSKQMVGGFVLTISEIASLLRIASVAEHVSLMNYSVLQRELAVLMDSLQNMHPETVGNGTTMLSQDFFNVPAPIPPHPSSVNYSAPQSYSTKGQYRTPTPVKDNRMAQVSKDSIKDTKDSRHENIIKLLKAGKPLGIKDFAREIKDCSEKTIQRELLAMVEKGVLKKTGERRWSLYSLS